MGRSRRGCPQDPPAESDRTRPETVKTALERFVMTVSCHDTDQIPKVADAGFLREIDGQSVQIMHEGTLVAAGAYCGDWMTDIIRSLRGHHEPQEEFAFHHLLRYVRHKSVIVELGAWWGYYTNWYLRAIPLSRALCVEPDPVNLAVCRTNLRLNSNEHRARLIAACAGATEGLTGIPAQAVNDGAPLIDMSGIMKLVDDQFVEVLHLDIQGAELPFLTSMRRAVARQKVRFVVASTHHESFSGSDTTHADCLDLLRGMGAHILCEHSVSESYSGDGLIVASFLDADQVIELPPISRNRAANSLFG